MINFYSAVCARIITDNFCSESQLLVSLTAIYCANVNVISLIFE
jgi:hypothetical protein